ncbi:MAG: NADP oxidoreductase, partial [Lysobacterales bacterium]
MTHIQRSIHRKKDKLVVATAPLCGCFGCHMSLLDIDERILDLVELVTFDRSPITDIKKVGRCDIGLIEGGVANAHNVHDLRDFRANCEILVAVGSCAVTGGIPAMRNQFDLEDCLEEAFVKGVGVHNPGIPNDPEIPLLLN